MNMGTSTSFAEQEAAAMEKNREAFMALWNAPWYFVDAGDVKKPASSR